MLLVTAHLTAGLSPLTTAGVNIVTKLLPRQGITDFPNSQITVFVGYGTVDDISCNHMLRIRGRVSIRQQLRVNATAISHALPSFKEVGPTACRPSKPKSQTRIRMKRSRGPQQRSKEHGQSAGRCSPNHVMNNCAVVLQGALG